jgi:hypothetical protein
MCSWQVRAAGHQDLERYCSIDQDNFFLANGTA